MSDWIPSQAGLRGHPKLSRAARALSTQPSRIAGCLHFLWYWALEYAPDGDLEDFEAADIAEAADWHPADGDPETFVDALLACGSRGRPGFLERLDGRLVIHDWEQNQGDRFRARIQAAAKKRAQRAAKQQHETANVPETGDTVPNSRDLARANDRPTDRTDRTDRQERVRATTDPLVDNSLDPTDALVNLCRSEVAGWEPSDQDAACIRRGLLRLPVGECERIIVELATYQDEKRPEQRYKNPRLALAKWLAKERRPETPTEGAQRPRSTITPKEPPPTPEERVASIAAAKEAAEKVRAMIAGIGRSMP